MPSHEHPVHSKKTLSQVRQWFRRGARYLGSSWRKKALSAFFLLLTMAVIGGIIAANWSLLTTYAWQFQPTWLVGSIILLLFDMFLGALAWHHIVARLTPYNHGRHNMQIWWYANLAKRIPGTFWYIGSRALLYKANNVSGVTISILSGLEMALIFISGIIVSLLTLPFWALPSLTISQISQSWFLLILIPVCLILIHPRILEKIWGMISKQAPSRMLNWRDTLILLVGYAGVWLVGGLVLFCVANFFQPFPWSRLVAMFGVWAVAGSFSLAGTLTLTGFGVREVSLVLLLAQWVPTPVALIISVSTRILWLLGELILALLSLNASNQKVPQA